MADKKVTVYIVYYSMYGHIKKMADQVAAGAKEAGVEVKLFQIAETLPEAVLKKMGAPPKSDDPTVDVHSLAEADAIVFGFPTRFGMMAAQAKSMFDQTGGLWQKGALAGKVASFFTSTGTQGGGTETTILTAYTQAAHHGMLIAPIGYTNPALFGMDEVHGCSPHGASCFAGPDGSRQPSEMELGVARHQGKLVAGYAAKLRGIKTADL